MRFACVVELLEHVAERDCCVGLLGDPGDPRAAREVVDTVWEQHLGARNVAPVNDVHLRGRSSRRSSISVIVAVIGVGWRTHLGYDKGGDVAGAGSLVGEGVDGIEKGVE